LADLSRAGAAALIEENAAEFLLALGRAGGGEEHNEPHIHWIIGGSPIAYHNCVVRCDLTPEQADEEIEASIARFRAHGVPGSWHLGPSARPADLFDRLMAHSFTGGPGGEPGMAADLGALPEGLSPPEGLVVERVRDADALARWAHVLSLGFGEGEKEAFWVRDTYARIGLGDEVPWRHYLGRLHGEPVATASLFLAVGVAGVYFVSTAPEHRRQGIGAAITSAAMHAARDEGYHTAVLGASAMGYRLYQRLGFREYCRIPIPEWEPPPPPAKR
jgi:ribosomal protein S18 acetylase RimI-like enzyme